MCAASFDFNEVFDPQEYLYFYEETLATEDTPQQVTFVEQELGLSPGSKILDVGCGHGRHALELARRGHKVFGIDLVPGFVDLARAEAERQGLTIEFAVGDARGLRVNPVFDAAICLFDAFGFFDDAGSEAMLRSVFDTLRPGGKLLLDTRNRDWIVRSILPVTVLDKGDDMMVDRHHFDTETGRLVDRRTYVRRGAARTVTFSVRLFSFTELSFLLRVVGFAVDAVYGGWDGSPLAASKNRMILVCSKP